MRPSAPHRSLFIRYGVAEAIAFPESALSGQHFPTTRA